MHKDFDAAAREVVGEPLTFTLGGEDFTCSPELPAIPVLKLAAAADEEGAEAVLAFYVFIQSMLAAEDVERFEAMATRERIGFDRLLPVVQWIMVEATGRPTQPPSALPERRQAASPSSMADSSSPDIPAASSA